MPLLPAAVREGHALAQQEHEQEVAGEEGIFETLSEAITSFFEELLNIF